MRKKKERKRGRRGNSNINPELNYTAYFPDGYYTDIHTFSKDKHLIFIFISLPKISPSIFLLYPLQCCNVVTTIIEAVL